MNEKLIGDFRELVNDNIDFMLQMYADVEGKNHWNLVCACMDWISIAVRYVSNRPQWSDDIDMKSMEVYSYISAIDIVFGAVTQLHRAILKTKDEPFKGEHEVFRDASPTYDDNAYFKQLRATFGAHPVDIRDDRGKWFASWPFDKFTKEDNDLEIRLYSGLVKHQDRTLGLRLSELDLFFNSRYGHLSFLMGEILRQEMEYRAELAKVPISIVDDPLEQVKLLRSASEQRFDNDYYRGILDELIIIFSTVLDESELHDEEIEYKKSLLSLVSEIRENLQSMTIVDLLNEKILNPDNRHPNLRYTLEKLYNFQFDKNREPLFSYHLTILNDLSNSKYNFKMKDLPDVVRLKMKMMLFWISRNGSHPDR